MKKLCACVVASISLSAWANPIPSEQPSNYPQCLESLQDLAAQRGLPPGAQNLIGALQWQSRVIELDRRQPEFSLSFGRYFDRAVSAERVRMGQEKLAEQRSLLKELTREYGVPGRYLVAFWGMETNYGGYMGNTPSLDALATLACDTRRSGFFREELLNALKVLHVHGLDPAELRGSWAGALGQVQFMPSNYVRYGRDGDSDGRVDLFSSTADALTSAAHFLSQLGWQRGERWGREVLLPTGFDYALADGKTQRSLGQWQQKGVRRIDGSALPAADLQARLLVPAGADGPAFLVYPNFSVIKRWNNSDYYAIAVGHLADRLVRAPELHRPAPIPSERMALADIQRAQQRLNDLGYNAGPADGIAGSGTRAAIRAYQQQQGLVADGHLDLPLLEQLGVLEATP
nr:lytic murein transglycosylase [Oceanococcus sp. HetDA_MAG_MS8]